MVLHIRISWHWNWYLWWWDLGLWQDHHVLQKGWMFNGHDQQLANTCLWREKLLWPWYTDDLMHVLCLQISPWSFKCLHHMLIKFYCIITTCQSFIHHYQSIIRIWQWCQYISTTNHQFLNRHFHKGINNVMLFWSRNVISKDSRIKHACESYGTWNIVSWSPPTYLHPFFLTQFITWLFFFKVDYYAIFKKEIPCLIGVFKLGFYFFTSTSDVSRCWLWVLNEFFWNLIFISYAEPRCHALTASM